MNKFKVGDRVRIIGTKLKGSVIGIEDVDCSIMIDGKQFKEMYRYEWLIKLKKKQRLEGWANLYKGNDILYRTKEEAEEMGKLSQYYIRTVKMREVKDE